MTQLLPLSKLTGGLVLNTSGLVVKRKLELVPPPAAMHSASWQHGRLYAYKHACHAKADNPCPRCEGHALYVFMHVDV